MKLALECRTDMLEMVQPFADFDWVLADIVLKDEKYAKYYLESGNAKFVDNSVNELGEPLPLDKLVEAFEKVKGTYVVAPDFLGNSEATVKAYFECLKKFPKEKVAGVVQGETFVDAFGCLKAYGSGIVCIPYDLCSKKTDPPWIMGLRRALFVSNIPEGFMVHLLGFTSLDELFWYQGKPMVGTIDTGVPVLLGLEGGDILEPLPSKEAPTFNKMEKIELTQKGWAAIMRNIALLRRYLP